MLREKDSDQGRLQLVNIEDLVPADHLLRKIDKYWKHCLGMRSPNQMLALYDSEHPEERIK